MRLVFGVKEGDFMREGREVLEALRRTSRLHVATALEAVHA